MEFKNNLINIFKGLKSHEIQINHFQQLYNWDCGLTCVSMVLQEKDQVHFMDNYSKICAEEGFNRSTWTIDLCFLLWRYKIPHEYYTITLGVHADYKNNNFYKHILTTDEVRINNRFETALNCGFKIYQKSLDINKILDHLLIGPIIVLTNSYLLNCDCCKRRKQDDLQYFTQLYQGHYVVLCGFNISEKLIFYHNPALRNQVCRISFKAFNNARRSFGTDEDILLIFK